ncbi:hypothetical protein MLD38_009822 [Melastoma candidum]|uniref:Uncharacterized protein n=1 Tax=Melastoma candidum TaxID=119954 RepID=A0ACB9S1U4_9MYRT|nr:hypothetical protein MLD38_009822 [Melastoma candidum]
MCKSRASVNASPPSKRGASSARSNTSASAPSLSNIKHYLPESPHIYPLSHLLPPSSSSSPSLLTPSSTWHSVLPGTDRRITVTPRKLRRPVTPAQLQLLLSVICRSHHSSIVSLVGASVSGNYVYLVYEFVKGATLSDCLRNRLNPGFTVLSSWMSRVQIASDVAHGLDYMHHCTGTGGGQSGFVHNHISSESVIVVEPSLNARICDFGAAELCGEVELEFGFGTEEAELASSCRSGDLILGNSIGSDRGNSSSNQKVLLGLDIDESELGKKTGHSANLDDVAKVSIGGGDRDQKVVLKRSKSRGVKLEGIRGYMAPEYVASGIPMQKSDVYAFGVVLLELLSGEEALRYVFDEANEGVYSRVSVVESARGAARGGTAGVRRWMDKRLKDSYPVDVAEKMMRLALECVGDDASKRPDMGHIAVLISKLYLESKNWAEKFSLPVDFSVSMAPR